MCTKEELFKDNYKFAFWLVRKKFPMLANDDDIKQEALIGLWKACCVYDESAGKFTALATRCVTNQILMWLRKSTNQCKLVACSLEDTIHDTDDLTVADTIQDPDWGVEFCRMEFEQSLTALDKRKQLILNLKLDGLNQRRIANILGISQSHVSRLMKSAMKQLEA